MKRRIEYVTAKDLRQRHHVLIRDTNFQNVEQKYTAISPENTIA